MQKTKKIKASVLVFALIILFIGIAAAIGIASSTMISQKNSVNTASSTQSFQVADSGAEIVLNKIKNASDGDTLGSLGLSCSGGVITGNIGTGKEYKITTFKIDESNPITDCSASLSDIDRIKSIGSYKNTNRAVEVAVAAEGGSYQLSCTYEITPGMNIWSCCRMNIGDGTAECKATTDGINWHTYASPWSSSSSGEFEISCTYASSSGNNYWSCCRINTEDGNTECKATTDGNSWHTYSSPWD